MAARRDVELQHGADKLKRGREMGRARLADGHVPLAANVEQMTLHAPIFAPVWS